MALNAPTQGESIEPATRPAPSNKGGNFADLLAGLDNGIRITGIVLAAEPPKSLSGLGKGGKPYAFQVREVQIWTGNKAVTCKDQRDANETFPAIMIGERATFRVKSVRMNGALPVFEIDTES